jgi:hypothetical protein
MGATMRMLMLNSAKVMLKIHSSVTPKVWRYCQSDGTTTEYSMLHNTQKTKEDEEERCIDMSIEWMIL